MSPHVHPVAVRKRERDHSRDLTIDEPRLETREFRRRRATVRRFSRHEVEHRLLLRVAGDSRVRLVHEIAHAGAEPVVATRVAVVLAHALLHDGPLAITREEEAVMVDVEAVLYGGGVHLRGHAAVVRETRAVHSERRADRQQLVRRLP